MELRRIPWINCVLRRPGSHSWILRGYAASGGAGSRGAAGPGQSHYEVMGLPMNAPRAKIKAAFVELSKEIHPDLNPNDPKNHDKFVRLNEAYTVLNKASSRHEYDFSLAQRLHQQNRINKMSSSHTTGAFHGPGTQADQHFYESDEQQQRVFWDQTIWHMRDRSKDFNAYYGEDSYYGIKGVRRQPNSYILAGCFVLIALGGVYFFFAFKWSQRKRRQAMEKFDRQNLAYLNEARARAREYGNAKQLEILGAKLAAEAQAWKSSRSVTKDLATDKTMTSTTSTDGQIGAESEKVILPQTTAAKINRESGNIARSSPPDVFNTISPDTSRNTSTGSEQITVVNR